MKNLYAALIVVGLISMAVGLGLGRAFAPEPETSRPQVTDTPEYRQLLAEHERLGGRLDAIERGITERDQTIAALREALSAAQATIAKVAESAPAAADGAEPGGSSIDWARLSSLFAERADLFAAVSELMRKNVSSIARSLPPDDALALRDLVLEWGRAATQARRKTPYPFLDDEFLPEVVGVLLGETLGLSEAQVRELGDAALALLAENPVAEDATPLRAFAARADIVSGLEGHLDRTLDPAQRERWDAMGPFLGRLLDGDQIRYDFGLAHPEGLRRELLDQWRETYSLEPEQIAPVEAMIGEYAQEARKVLERYGQVRPNPRDLQPGERERLEKEFLELELTMEERVLPHLSEEQRRRIQSQWPLIVRMADDGNFNVATDSMGGF